MTNFSKADLAPYISELEAAVSAALGAGVELSFDDRSNNTPFDLHGFDTRLALTLGIETPDDYAQRKAEQEGLAMPVAPVDEHSFARKLVSLLGKGWEWSVSSDSNHATVFRLGAKPAKFTIKGDGPVALRFAALFALSESCK